MTDDPSQQISKMEAYDIATFLGVQLGKLMDIQAGKFYNSQWGQFHTSMHIASQFIVSGCGYVHTLKFLHTLLTYLCDPYNRLQYKSGCGSRKNALCIVFE